MISLKCVLAYFQNGRSHAIVSTDYSMKKLLIFFSDPKKAGQHLAFFVRQLVIGSSEQSIYSKTNLYRLQDQGFEEIED